MIESWRRYAAIAIVIWLIGSAPVSHAQVVDVEQVTAADIGAGTSSLPTRVPMAADESRQTPRPTVTIGFDTVAGAPRYADRAESSGSLGDVRFVTTRLRPSGSLQGMPTRLPVRGARLSSRYGYRIHPITGRGSSHRGVDLAVAQGTAVSATLDGVVGRASWAGGYGLLVTVNHGGGLETRYAHLSSIAVRPGQAVQAGQMLGRSGASGNTTGPHVHYEVRRSGVAVDPLHH